MLEKKTAERLLIELRDKLPAHAEAVLPEVVQTSTMTTIYHDAVNALLALGYKLAEAKQMVNHVIHPEASCEEVIRLALQVAK